MEMLLQGLPNVIALPAPEPRPAAASRLGTPHTVRRMLAEDKLETHEIVIFKFIEYDLSQQARPIYDQDMPLASVDFFAGIVTPLVARLGALDTLAVDTPRYRNPNERLVPRSPDFSLLPRLQGSAFLVAEGLAHRTIHVQEVIERSAIRRPIQDAAREFLISHGELHFVIGQAALRLGQSRQNLPPHPGGLLRIRPPQHAGALRAQRSGTWSFCAEVF